MTQKTLIAFDGLDGSGKETQTRLLTEYFKKANLPFRYLSFPTYHKDTSCLVKLYLDGAFGENPENVNPYAASSFYAADRYASFALDWKKDYDEGKIILCNRYTTANAVHQLCKLPESLWEVFLDWLYDYEFNKLQIPKPDLTVYLCVPPEVAEKYIKERAAEKARTPDIHEKSRSHLAKSYAAALYSAKKLGWKTIFCAENGALRPLDDIFEEVKKTVKEFVHGREKERDFPSGRRV